MHCSVERIYLIVFSSSGPRKIYCNLDILFYILTVSYTHLDVYKRQGRFIASLMQLLHPDLLLLLTILINYLNYSNYLKLLIKLINEHTTFLITLANYNNYNSFVTVSYTHLDVYKRQVMDNEIQEKIINLFIGLVAD